MTRPLGVPAGKMLGVEFLERRGLIADRCGSLVNVDGLAVGHDDLDARAAGDRLGEPLAFYLGARALLVGLTPLGRRVLPREFLPLDRHGP
jgi:hypothetical protein